ncbi:MAG: tetratricopeptide repeat protein [Anaerolineae bacterium]|nr:tetratricopeptide repeat protein [Anaerolineae bacterium]
MRLRDWLILAVALFLVSTLIGVALLVYLANRPAVTPAAGVTPTAPGTLDATLAATIQAGQTPDPNKTPVPGRTDPAAATPGELPALVTPTQTSTPLPTSTPSPTATTTPTPTPTLTPSPTPEPATRMARAYQARQNGDYRRAIAEFEIVEQIAEGESERLEAAYQIGVCAFLDGNHIAARDRLLAFVQQNPDDHRTHSAHFYLAQALDGLGQYEDAIGQYQAYLAHQDILADLVYTRIGDNYVRLQQHDAAVEAYKHALDAAVDLGQRYDLREKIGLAYSAAGLYDDAIGWFYGVIERSENVYRLARLWYLIGESHRLAGREQDALDAFVQATNADPQPPYAYLALVELVDAGVEVDDYQRGLIDYYAGSYAAAVAAFYRYMEAAEGYNSDAHYYVAQSLFDAGSFDLAIQECERMIDAYAATAPRWGDMWLIKGQALYSLERVDQAAQAYIEFAERYPEHVLAPQARWQAAWMLEREDRFQEAADIYTALADEHVNAEKAPVARFRAGICRYRSGDSDAAMLDWRELLAVYPASSAALQARYWLGKVLWAYGEVEEARGLLRKLADEHPRDFYGIRAAHMLANGGRSAPWIDAPDSLHLTSDEEAEEVKAAGWLRTWAGLGDDTDPMVISSNLAEDIRFRRGMEMWSLGMCSQACTEFESLRKNLYQDPLLLYQFAFLTRDLGIYASSLRATIDLITLAPEPTVLDMPRLVQRMAFPVYFADVVLGENTPQDEDSPGADPLLILALIRQESVFEQGVTSWAGAVGLTQVMPETGTWIAEMMPWSEYADTDQPIERLLQRAYINVKFGTWFINRILEQTEGNVMAALAGYNGGPGNGVYWLEQSGGDPDLLIEIINYDEPQRYVREIYRHYDMYVRLYGTEQN